MFERISLKDLGLRIQLGHWNDVNRRCSVPEPAIADDFVIIDIHGVHKVALDYCGCGRGGHPTAQLLRAQLWPATTTNPKTAATFAVLRHYHLLSFESKCSALEFYNSLARQTNNLGFKKRKKSRQWEVCLLNSTGDTTLTWRQDKATETDTSQKDRKIDKVCGE